MDNKRVSLLFLSAGLVCLIVGVFFGLIGGLQYVLPDFFREYLSFEKTRPLHVSLVVTWIFTGAVGGIYYYLPTLYHHKLYSVRLAYFHFILFILTGIAILVCYFTGNFGGREYLEFPPILALPMIATWILFMINFVMTINKKIKDWPVYMWMWTTGLIFFLITFGEAYLWTLPYFHDNIIRDVTIQWKANGSMVGSWNMLVYGTGFYVMEQISGDKKTATSPTVYFFYFLGLTNLMFNWGHHTYIVPAAPWIKNVAYIISMTELLILGNIIWYWRKSISAAKKNFHKLPYLFLAAADIWIFLNLLLAILISIPAINLYTHGTHITVAHAMGSTIGINTMILFSSLYFIFEKHNFTVNRKQFKIGFWMVNISLLIFWATLITAGITKAVETNRGTVFQTMMERLSPLFNVINTSGLGIFIGVLLISFPLLFNFAKKYLSTGKMLFKKEIL